MSLYARNFTKKSRLSLGGKRYDKKHQTPSTAALQTALDPLEQQPVMERRWSVVGAGWSRKKSATVTSDSSHVRKSMTAACNRSSSNSPTLAASGSAVASSSDSVGVSSETLFPSKFLDDLKIGGDNDSDFMRISKSEYEAIKERVSAIETRISKEFQTVQGQMDTKATRHEIDTSFLTDTSMTIADGSSALDKVVDKYEKTLGMQTESKSSPSTDQLAKRLSRELKIRRRSSEQPIVIRSPSARKIGTMRRRSRENVRVSRNFSWHMAPNVESTRQNSSPVHSPIEPPLGLLLPIVKANLKRGRPNTLQTGLRHPSPTKKPQLDVDDIANDQWTSAETFFAEHQTPIKVNQENNEPIVATTPFFVTTASLNEMKTPMLPPRRPLNNRTPLHVHNANRTPMLPPRSTPQKSSVPPINKALILTPMEDTQTGRASIARLRSQNAGMVAAKAKLFNGFVTETISSEPTTVSPPAPRNAMPRESSAFAFQHFAAQRIAPKEQPHRAKPTAPRPSLSVRQNNSPRKSMTPRRGTKNLNGIHRRQKLRLAKSPIKKASPMRLRHLLMDESTTHSSLVKDVTKISSPRGKTTPINRIGFRAAMESIVNESPLSAVSRTPHIKQSLALNSPRRINKSTPAGAPHRSTPIKLRHSPAALQLHRAQRGHLAEDSS